MQKVSEWIKENTGSHLIQDATKLQASFETETGKTDKLPTQSVRSVRQAIAARGLGGHCEGEPNDRVCSGYEVAEFLASIYGDHSYQNFMGRGSRWRRAVASIEEKGN